MSTKTDTAISVKGLGKAYSIAHNQSKHTTAAEALMHRLRHPFERVERETFWALRDVSFDIRKGDVVGIIGRNGAGKSTLLKVLSRITEPTTGEIDVYGRVGSLLEVGTGFHPELTGRENIFLNGAILGMKRREIERQFDAIVDFAGVEQFLDTPVKRYSSGMYVRLAFAVAAHLNPEILVVDEVLAVGDAEFQKKCLGKMKDVSTQEGRTVLFVSHNMAAIASLTQQALYLGKGSLQMSGKTAECITRYAADLAAPDGALVPAAERSGSGEIRIESVAPMKPSFGSGEEKRIAVKLGRLATLAERAFIVVEVEDESGEQLMNLDSRLVGFWIPGETGERIGLILTILTPWLKPGRYALNLQVYAGRLIDEVANAVTLDILPILPYADPTHPGPLQRGRIYADYSYQITEETQASVGANVATAV